MLTRMMLWLLIQLFMNSEPAGIVGENVKSLFGKLTRVLVICWLTRWRSDNIVLIKLV